MISLKRYIDSEHTSAALLRALLEVYKGTLAATGAAAAQACPSLESSLEKQLAAIGEQMTAAETPEAIDAAGSRAASQLDLWGEQAEQDLKRKTADVKELLVTLAHTASSVAASDAEHVLRFDALTARLEKIATLDDVAQLRSAVLSSAKELRKSVEIMSQSTRVVLKEMQSELDEYQAKLEAAQKMAAQDVLTGLMNRHRIELAIERRIQRGKPFSVGLVDLDGFKGINDRLGHQSGDDLLRQFSADLKSNTRATDSVGRWGGDEFVIVFDGSAAEANTHFSRLHQWVGGAYSIAGPNGKVKVQIELSIGVAEWRAGISAAMLIEQADQRMYAAKRSRR